MLLQTNETLVGTSSITVPLNSAPYCSSSPLFDCIALDITEGVFPAAKFTAYTTAWADPDNDTLTYEFGVLGALGPQQLSTGGATSYIFSSLLPGLNTLYVCAVDTYGARSCQQASVKVYSPRRRLDTNSIADQIMNIDDSLGQSGSSSAPSIVDAAMQVASLLSYSAANAVSHALSNGLFGGFYKELGSVSGSSSALQSVPAVARKAPVQNATNQLLVLLSRSGSVKDVSEMNSLMAAAAQLSRSSSVTPAAGRAVLDLYK